MSTQEIPVGDRWKLFPAWWAAGVDERVADVWDLSGVVPVPRELPVHWSCQKQGRIGGGAYIVKTMRFKIRNTRSKSPWRCDVYFKCVDCSKVTPHGVKVPREMFLTADRLGLTKGEIEHDQITAALVRSGWLPKTMNEVAA